MKWLVSYDLDKPGQDYKRIDTELKRLGAVRVLDSEWALESSKSAVQLRDYFNSFIDSTDRLLISPLENWASWNLMTDINKVWAA